MLAETKLRSFIESVAAKTPTPGGGSVSVAACAMGTALAIMAARYSDGPAPAEASEKLEALKDEFIRLIDADAAAYDRVDAALGLPKESPEEKTRRKEALQDALKEAAEVPLQGMQTAAKALESILTYAPACKRRLASDLGSAALMIEAGLLGCGLNVQANARLLEDRAVVERLDLEGRRLVAEGNRLRGEILKHVEAMYRK
ncbi:MAG: cyclodeaminase/cyclohydrolase family protein [Planctomycetes bacterium]|nr:cyclodeaminase/cyclohydrolase family protein [Planctomycetota bacterium]